MAQTGGFVNHHVWVTPYRDEERYAAGDYPNQSGGGDGLTRWTQQNRSVEDTDVVVWYTFGHTHLPRPEDYPVMPSAYIGFTLKPNGFFTMNPANDGAALDKSIEAGSVRCKLLHLTEGLPLNEAQRRLLSVFVDTYLKLTPEEERQYQRNRAKLGPEEERKEMVMTTSWEQKGIEKGLQQGIETGLQQGEAYFALRVLTKKFGSLAPELQDRVHSLSTEQLETLALTLLDFTEIGQVRAWLNAHAGTA